MTKDQDSEKPVRYEMSSMSNQNVSSEIIRRSSSRNNPYMENSDDSTYFSLNSEMVECDANEDLFQYMRHRSLVLEIWIDQEKEEEEGTEEQETVLVGLAHVDLSGLVSFSENRNAPTVVEWKRGSVEDPMTGAVVGTVRGIVALGYSNQLEMIRKTRDTTNRLKRCARRWLSERRIVITNRTSTTSQSKSKKKKKKRQRRRPQGDRFSKRKISSSPEKDVSSSDFSSSLPPPPHPFPTRIGCKVLWTPWIKSCAIKIKKM